MGGPDTADLCAVDPDSAPSKAIVFFSGKSNLHLSPPEKCGKIKSVDKIIARVQTAVDKTQLCRDSILFLLDSSFMRIN